MAQQRELVTTIGWVLLLALWTVGPLLAWRGVVADIASTSWWARLLVAVVVAWGVVTYVVLWSRARRSTLVESESLLRPAVWLAWTAASAVVLFSVVVLLRFLRALADGHSLQTALADAVQSRAEPSVILAGGLLWTLIRLRRQRIGEDEVAHPAFGEEIRRLHKEAESGGAIAQLLFIDYLVKRAERHGDRRRLAVESMCAMIRMGGGPVEEDGPAPSVPLQDLQARLVLHLRFPGVRSSVVRWWLRSCHAGRRGPRGYWPGLMVDLTNALLRELDMEGCRVAGAHFRGARLCGRASFGRSWYQTRVPFVDARFQGVADFELVTFRAGADFDRTIFHGDANFTGVRFDRTTTFRGAEFHGTVRFSSVVRNLDLTGAVVSTRAATAIQLPEGWVARPDDGSGRRPIVRRSDELNAQAEVGLSTDARS